MHNSFFTIVCIMAASYLPAQQSFTLEEAILYGLENHRDIQNKEIDIALAEKDIRDLKSTGMPRVSGSVNYQYYAKVPVQATPDFLTPAVYGVLFQEDVIPRRELGQPETFKIGFVQPHNLTAAVEASMLAFDGSYLVGLEAAKLYRELVSKELNTTEQSIKANITKAYMAVLITMENLKVVDNNLSTISETLRETKAIYKEGFIESLDVDRLTLSYNNLITEREKLTGTIKLTKNLLKFQMDYPLVDDIILDEELESLILESTVDETLANIDYSKRAEYDVLNTSKKLNELDVKRYKRGYLPSLRVFATAQQSLQRKNLFDASEAGWLPALFLGAGINIPIYDGGEKSAKIQKAKLNIQKIDLMISTFESSVRLEAQNAIISLTNAQKTVDNTREALQINKRIFEKTQIKFKEGVGSSLEVTQAESDLYQAQGAYINALYQLITARADLEIALGKI